MEPETTPPAAPGNPQPPTDGAGQPLPRPEFKVPVAEIIAAARAAEREEVLAEISRLRNEKSGWGHNTLVLLGSLALFIVVGLKQITLGALLVILGVIVFHELGHYLGMLAFGYRDVRMFFIPFFGAAVSGRGGGVEGWKRAMVSLLGPLPGFAAGIVCAQLGAAGDNQLLQYVALILLLLNVLNLLPIAPLDGGRLVQDVLLSRNRYLDAAFRVASAALLIYVGLGLMTGMGKLFAVTGLFPLLSLPSAMKFGRMSERLRPELGAAAACCGREENIPPEALERLIAEVRMEEPNLPDTRAVAWRVDLIWERLQVVPPSWPATGAFLFVQFAALALGAMLLKPWFMAMMSGK